MTHRRAIDKVRQEFELMLEDKTSWGRLEVKRLLERAISNVYIGIADNENKLSEDSVLMKKSKTYPRALSGRKRNRNKAE